MRVLLIEDDSATAQSIELMLCAVALSSSINSTRISFSYCVPVSPWDSWNPPRTSSLSCPRGDLKLVNGRLPS